MSSLEPSVPVYFNGKPFPLRAALLRDPVLPLLLLLPFALLALDSSWFYSLPMRDPWIYYGYFHNATKYADEFPDRYFSSRLSVILPGFFLDRALALPPLAVNLILRLTLFWTAVFSFYGVCKLTLGPRTALLSAIALGSHPFFLMAVGSNYVDGFGIAYFLLALLCLTLVARSPAWRLCLVVAGGAATALVTANLFYVVYLPFLALWFLLVNRAPDRRPLWPALGLVTAGAAALFLAFGAVNRLFGGPFFYLISSIRFSTSAVQQPNPFYHPVDTWIGMAGWLVIPAVVLLASVPSLWLARREPVGAKRRFLVSAQLQFLGFSALLILLHAGADMASLEYFYYASMLVPMAFLAFAAQVEPLVRNLSPRSFALLAGAAALALVALSALPFAPERLAALPGPPVLLPLVVGLGVAVAVGFGATGAMRVRRSFRAALTAMLCLAASQGLARQAAISLHDIVRHFDGDARGFFLQAGRSFTLLQDADPSHQLRIWYDIYNGSEGRLGDMIASTFLLCPRMVGDEFPRLESNRMMCDGTLLEPGTRIAVLSARPDAAAQAQASLQGVGLAGRVTARHEIGGPVHGFAITFLDVFPAEAAPQATRTWVSGVGDDANPCSRTAPCKTFAGAIWKTAAGGEISTLDPGGFGVVTITKAITISGDGTLSGILAAGTNGIIVNAGVNDRVIIRGISINGIGTGLNGVRYLAGKELVIENTTISGFTTRGVDVALAADAGTLTMKNVSIRNVVTGVRLTTTVGNVVGVLENVSMGGAATGIDAAANSQVLANNCAINRGGIGVNASTGSSLITVENSTISYNGTGVTPSAGGGVIRLSNNAIYNNTTGIAISSGQVFSDGTNRVFGNGSTAGALTGSVTRQ